MQNFFKTVAVVTVFSVSEKFLGFLYRIFLSRTIGAEGIGLYQIALSVFALLLTVSCSGVPITVSRLMTKYKAENKNDRVGKIITAGLSVALFSAIPICILFFLLHNNLTFIFADERCKTIFFIILPGLIFTSVYSVLRGVFWGNKDFLPYSIIELLEEVCMIVVGVILVTISHDVYQGALGAGIAVLVSYVFSFSLATTVFFIRKNKLKNPISELKPLLQSATPITAMRTANSLIMSLVSIILPMRLISAGMSNSEAVSLFGSAVGQAIPILFIPTTLIGSFTLVLVPEISENFYKKKDFYLKRDIEKAIKFAVILTCVFIPVFTICGEEIGIIIFGNQKCGEYLTASSYLMLFMSISNITTSILNSMGFEVRTLLYFILSSVLMFLCIWFLPAVIGVYALLVGFTFVFGLTSLLNLILINKKCPQKPKYFNHIIKSCLLCLPTLFLGLLLEKMLLAPLGIVVTFFITAICMCVFYGLLAVCLGLVSSKAITKVLKSLITKRSRNKVAG